MDAYVTRGGSSRAAEPAAAPAAAPEAAVVPDAPEAAAESAAAPVATPIAPRLTAPNDRSVAFTNDYRKSHPPTEIVSETHPANIDHHIDLRDKSSSSMCQLFPDAPSYPTAAAASTVARGPAATSIQDALKDLIGLCKLKESLVGMGDAIDYQNTQDGDISFPPNMVLIGQPGAGKTTIVERIFRGLIVGGVLKGKLVTINGLGDVPKQTQEQYLKDRLEEAGDGGIIFIDEVHQLTGKRNGFLYGLLNAMANTHQDKIVFVIAHYPEDIESFFKKADSGFMSRFDYASKGGWHYFDPYTADQLVQMADMEMAKLKPPPSFADAEAREAMMALASSANGDARVVKAKAVASIKRSHDARMSTLFREDRAAHDEQRGKWTASDIRKACGVPPAAAASSHAPTAAGEGRGGSTSSVPAPAAALVSSEAAASSDASLAQRKRKRAPAAAAAAEAAAGARLRSRSSSLASNSAAIVGPSKADAAAETESDSEEAASDSEEAASDSEKAAPLSNRARTDMMLTAIDAHYVPKAGGTSIVVMDFLRQLLPNLTGTVKSEVDAAQRVAKRLRLTLQKAIKIKQECGVNTMMYQDVNRK